MSVSCEAAREAIDQGILKTLESKAFFEQLKRKKEEEEEPLTPEVLSFLARQNVQALEAMDRRVAAVERSQPVTRKSDGNGNVINLPPLAAE